MATSYLSPGVYVEEVDRGSKPIEAVGTNTVGFLGESAKGPINESVLITNWSQFVKTFGDFKDCSEHLAHAVYGFFNNGGSRCFVVNVGAPRGGHGRQGARAQATRRTRRPRRRRRSAAAVAMALYIGRDGGPGARTGLKCFDEIDEIAIIAAPGQTSPAVQDALLSHCRDAQGSLRGSRLAGDDHRRRRQAARSRATRSTARTTSRGSRSMTRTRATSSFRRRATSRASTRAPTASAASTRRPANEIVRGALGLKYNVSKGEQDLLNPKGINAIRFMNGGIRIWGARTLSSDPSWRYINVRRLFIMVESSIERATQWVVFEPNDHRLWKRVQRTISSFLTLLWRNGALMGTTPGAGLLRQVRRGDQPARGHRRRPAGRRDRPRAGEAGGIRHLPHRPDGRPAAASRSSDRPRIRRLRGRGVRYVGRTRGRNPARPRKRQSKRGHPRAIRRVGGPDG